MTLHFKQDHLKVFNGMSMPISNNNTVVILLNEKLSCFADWSTIMKSCIDASVKMLLYNFWAAL